MQDSPSADDLDGRTALLLLTNVSPPARVLYVLPERQGVLGLSKTGETVFRTVRFAPDALPFVSGVIESTVVDLDATVRRQALRAAVIREVNRVLTSTGSCIIAAFHRRVPRDVKKWREYRVGRADRRWSALVAGTGRFAGSNQLFARVDRNRIIELRVPSKQFPASVEGGSADRRIMVFRRSGDAGRPSFLQSLFTRLQTSVGVGDQPLAVERCWIRRIGKTTLIVASGTGRRYVVRVARTAVAAERGQRNFGALETLWSTELISGDMKAIVPRPQVAGTIHGYPFYVEESLGGTARDDYGGWRPETGWEPDALRFISDLHAATMRHVEVDRVVFDQIIAAPLERIRDRCATREVEKTIGELRDKLEGAFMGERLPVVWSHGDLSAGNCLYDDRRRLSGVVDWELFSIDHLPMLDVLNVMEVPGERNSFPTWQRFDCIYSMFHDDRAPASTPLMSYVERIGIPRRLLRSLSVMYWADHAAKRIRARGDDAVWMRKRVLQPLSRLRSVQLS
jgi:hypothetical protein